MKRFFSLLFKREFKIPHNNHLVRILRSFSPTQKLLFYIFILALITSAGLLVWKANSALLVEVPESGGGVVEGQIGSPRFINPLLSFGDTDRDLTELIYAGLMKKNSDGTLSPELATNYNVSPDGLEYTFTLRDDAYFHDGQKVTADDIIYTIKAVSDDRVDSPKRAAWAGVEVEKIDEKIIVFRLQEAFPQFLDNTTLGILPEHLWGNIEMEQVPFSSLNIQPIGAGPYKLSRIDQQDNGSIKSYVLIPFDRYVLGKPYIEEFVFRFYENELAIVRAFERGDVQNISGISAKSTNNLSGNTNVRTYPLPRVFGVFFNQNEQPLFLEKSVRRALRSSVDKEVIIDEVFFGFAEEAETATPKRILEEHKINLDSEDASINPNEEAKEILEDAGWEFDEQQHTWTSRDGDDIKTLSFTLTTSNAPELLETAGILKREWEEIGVQVDLDIKDLDTLNQEHIRPRDYEALLFGQVINKKLDLFAFWHSSQRNDPGLNVALYANIVVDRALESMRTEDDPEETTKNLTAFEEEIDEDIPAIFLYTPKFIYVVSTKIKGLDLSNLENPSDRFRDVHTWYINTNRQWEIFTK